MVCKSAKSAKLYALVLKQHSAKGPCTFVLLLYHNVSLFLNIVFCADPPEYTVPSQRVTRFATGDESFTFDCTPSGGNPAVYSYTFRKGSVVVTEGASGSVLTINPVVRGSI